MANEQDKIEDAVVVTAVASTPWDKIVNYVKVGLATKKAVMAAYALFFATTAGVANYASTGGMTSEQAAVVSKMEQHIVTLETQVAALTSAHGEDAHDHAIVQHDHEQYDATIAELRDHIETITFESGEKLIAIQDEVESLAFIIVGIESLQAATADKNHSHPDEGHSHDTSHEHDPVVFPEQQLIPHDHDTEHEHKVIEESKKGRGYKSGILLDGVWIDL